MYKYTKYTNIQIYTDMQNIQIKQNIPIYRIDRYTKYTKYTNIQNIPIYKIYKIIPIDKVYQ